MRVVFLGTPEFAVPTLEALLAAPQVEVVGVFSQPDRKAGRGQRLSPPPVKQVAERRGVSVFQFESVRRNPEAVRVLASLRPDVGVVVAFGQILTPDFFECPPWGTLNVHASLLPSYRGAGPVAHAILDGADSTGVTIMKIDAGMDTGDILTQRTVPIPLEMTAGELADLLARVGAQLLVETLGPYCEGTLQPVRQAEAQASYAPRLTKEQGAIDWRRTALEIHNQVRGLNPWPGATFTWGELEVKLWRTHPRTLTADGGAAPPGTIQRATREELLVHCGQDTLLALEELQLPNRRRLSARDFINGTTVSEGGLFR